MLSKCSAFGKKDDVARVEKIPACLENRVSEKALLQFICLDQEHGSRVQMKFGTYKQGLSQTAPLRQSRTAIEIVP